ncbi:MAG TPA: YHS domain-containing protein [Mariprofundaceae bacterium]|nr:YHS domain-containing protein [Mariprofundaceae bacterium]
MTRDPVCLMAVHPSHATAMTEFGGRSYYFCSEECRDKFKAKPHTFIDKAPGMRLTVGVMGSADSNQEDAVRDKMYALGKAIAERGLVLITGACPGLPYECAEGARDAGGTSVGISPALSLDEHVHKYLSPSDAYDVLIYTGSGLMGREVTNIRSSDMVIIVGGRSGTLGEFAIAYDEGKLIGVLKGSGGITNQLPAIVDSFDKDTGSHIIYDADPGSLVSRLLSYYETKQFKRPSCFCSERLDAAG